MFLTLTKVLLWLLVFYIFYQVLLKWVPRSWFTVLGGLLLVAVAAIGFYDPNLNIPFEAWRIVSLPTQPLGLGFLLLLLGFGQIKGPPGGFRSLRSWFLWGGFLVLLLSSLPAVSNHLAYLAEQQVVETRQDWRELTQTVDKDPTSIVLLGKETTTPSFSYGNNIQLTDTGDRIIYTADLYQQEKRQTGRAPLVIVCAPLKADPNNSQFYIVEEAFDIANLLQKLGVSNRQIILATEGVDLRTSAVEVADILEDLGMKNYPIYLVSSALNSRRATMTFMRSGINVISTPSDYRAIQYDVNQDFNSNGLESFLPDPESLALTSRVVEEYMGSIYYFLRDWIRPIELD